MTRKMSGIMSGKYPGKRYATMSAKNSVKYVVKSYTEKNYQPNQAIVHKIYFSVSYLENELGFRNIQNLISGLCFNFQPILRCRALHKNILKTELSQE